jgi:hypothetical protein
VDQGGCEAIEDNGEGEGRGCQDIQVAEKDAGSYVRDGSQAWRVVVDAPLNAQAEPGRLPYIRVAGPAP